MTDCVPARWRAFDPLTFLYLKINLEPLLKSRGKILFFFPRFKNTDLEFSKYLIPGCCSGII